MKRNLLILIVIFLIAPLVSQAQYAATWKSFRTELIFGIGTNNFMGDLGGGDEQGGHFLALRDVDWAKTRPVFNVGLRYKIWERLAIRGNFNYAILSADDAESGYWTRQHRNLHFKSNVFELGALLEFSILKNSYGRRYLFTNQAASSINLYLFGGAAGIYFNPKAELDGEWHELQPLGTEGQGLTYMDEKMDDKYSLLSVAFPMGIGARYYLNNRWSIGLELGNRYTLTDYLDDVSGNYFDNDMLRAEYGDVAAQLADRHITNPSGLPAGADENGDGHIDGITDAPFPYGVKRGDDNYTDSYFFVIFSVNYSLYKALRGGPKYSN